MEVPRKNILQRLNKKDEEKGSRSLFWSRFPFLLRDFWTFTNSIKRRFLDKQKGRSLSSTLLPSIHMWGMKICVTYWTPYNFIVCGKSFDLDFSDRDSSLVSRKTAAGILMLLFLNQKLMKWEKSPLRSQKIFY